MDEMDTGRSGNAPVGAEERCSARVFGDQSTKKGFVIKLPSSNRTNQEWFWWKLNGIASCNWIELRRSRIRVKIEHNQMLFEQHVSINLINRASLRIRSQERANKEPVLIRLTGGSQWKSRSDLFSIFLVIKSAPDLA